MKGGLKMENKEDNERQTTLDEFIEDDKNTR
jgi:hypothetical protein